MLHYVVVKKYLFVRLLARYAPISSTVGSLSISVWYQDPGTYRSLLPQLYILVDPGMRDAFFWRQ